MMSDIDLEYFKLFIDISNYRDSNILQNIIKPRSRKETNFINTPELTNDIVTLLNNTYINMTNNQLATRKWISNFIFHNDCLYFILPEIFTLVSKKDNKPLSVTFFKIINTINKERSYKFIIQVIGLPSFRELDKFYISLVKNL